MFGAFKNGLFTLGAKAFDGVEFSELVFNVLRHAISAAVVTAINTEDDQFLFI